MVPLAGEIAVLVAYVLNTTGDARGTGRHNLTVLREMAVRLAETAMRRCATSGVSRCWVWQRRVCDGCRGSAGSSIIGCGSGTT